MHPGVVLALVVASAGPVGSQAVQPATSSVSGAPPEARGAVDNYEPNQRGADSRAQGVEPNPSPTADRIVPVESIGRSIETDDARRDAAEEKERNEKDLKAQQDMACAAWGMLGVFMASGVGLYLLARTLKYTRDAAEAGRDAVNEARSSVAEAQKSTAYAKESVEEARHATRVANETLEVTRLHGERQLRAYLGVTGTEIWLNQGPITELRIKNFGQTPAYGVMIAIGVGPDPKKPPTQLPKGTIDPGADARTGIGSPGVNPNNIRDMFIFGCITYRDCFGYARKTDFCYRNILINGKFTAAETDDGNEAT